MRLWHERLLPVLPRQQLLGQHRECCALRGLGWGKPHSVVNYVFDHPREWLCAYHMEVIRVMREGTLLHPSGRIQLTEAKLVSLMGNTPFRSLRVKYILMSWSTLSMMMTT